MKNDERCVWIDIAKGIGIILVMLGHTDYVSVWGSRWINSFHMPLFFVMAGLCYNESRYPNYFDYFKRKSSVLLYPYVSLSLFVIALMSVLYWGNDPAFSAYSLLCNMCRGATLGAFWFIWVLFEVELFYALISRLLHRTIERLSLCAICWFVAVALAGNPLPYYLDVMLLAIPFYGIGHSLRMVMLKKPTGTLVVGLISLGVVHALILYFAFPYKVGFSPESLHVPFLFFCLAMIGTWFVSGVSMFIESLGRYKYYGYVEKAFVFLGKNSIILLATHSALGISRRSWCASYPQLGSTTSKFVELCLLLALLFLLSGPMNWLIRIPKVPRKSY